LFPLHRYPRYGHITYKVCIHTCPPPRRGGHDVLIRSLCPLPYFSCVLSSLDIRLRETAVHTVSAGGSLPVSGSLWLFPPFPPALLSVQDDISTLAVMLPTALFFTNLRLHVERASPNSSLPVTEAGAVCRKFPRTPQSVYRGRGKETADSTKTKRNMNSPRAIITDGV
jgi:hypothetical protein